MHTVSKVDLDEMKFQALEHHLSEAHVCEASSGDDEFQYDFLESCDRVLQRHLEAFLKDHPLPSLAGHRLREQLAAQMDRFNDFDKEEVEPGVQLADCLDVLEQMEDPSRSWLLLAFFKPSLLSALYRHVEMFSRRSSEKTLDQIRRSFEALLQRSLILEGEESARLRMKLQHGGIQEVFYLLNRFLSAHLEYVQVVQEAYLSAYPELPHLLWEALLKEAPKALK